MFFRPALMSAALSLTLNVGAAQAHGTSPTSVDLCWVCVLTALYPTDAE